MSHDPKDRCQAVTSQGQCNYGKMVGADYCEGHAGRTHFQRLLKKNTAIYALRKYGDRVTDLVTVGTAHKSLHEEVAILRLGLEKLLNQSDEVAGKEDMFFLASLPMIGDLIIKIKSALESAHKLDQDEKRLLSKDKVVEVSNGILDVICEYVTDPDIREEIATKIAAIIEA